MKNKTGILNKKILAGVALAVFSHSAYSLPFTFEGRSLGMGGVAVATADLATAAWANPAMLTNQQTSDDFSLLIGIGAFGRDPENLLDDIQDFQDADERRVAAVAAGDTIGEIVAMADMASTLSGIDSKDIAVDVSGVAAMGIAFETFAMAVSIRADAIGAGTVDNLSCTLDDPGCDLAAFQAQITDPNFNTLTLEGVLATEVGVSFAKAFTVYDRKFSLGIKPKFVDVQGFSFSQGILTIDGIDDINNSDNKSDIGTFVSLDLGLSYDVAESFRLGLNLTNLVPADFTVAGAGTLNFDTGARLGAAYHNSWVTVGVDFDLVENKPLLANPKFGDLKTQYLALGAEFNAFDYAQLRVGASKNVANGIRGTSGDVLYSVGVGFWLGFNLDVAAVISENMFGAFLQTGFRF